MISTDRPGAIELPCTVLVESVRDPTSHDDLFFVNFTPKGYALPEGFGIYSRCQDVKCLEEFLAGGMDDFSWDENYHGEPEEDELNIDWAIKNLNVQVEQITCHGEKGLTNIFGEQLDPSIKYCKRLWPGETQGFFVCRLRKVTRE